mmetsp:Transcript_26494/g.48008  ORF Transcript_26494/g.48008 Transcript_26494/m.48008 type:complete len:277 (-) Transcript_26494:216-1046(-)
MPLLEFLLAMSFVVFFGTASMGVVDGTVTVSLLPFVSSFDTDTVFLLLPLMLLLSLDLDSNGAKRVLFSSDEFSLFVLLEDNDMPVLLLVARAASPNSRPPDVDAAAMPCMVVVLSFCSCSVFFSKSTSFNFFLKREVVFVTIVVILAIPEVTFDSLNLFVKPTVALSTADFITDGTSITGSSFTSGNASLGEISLILNGLKYAVLASSSSLFRRSTSSRRFFVRTNVLRVAIAIGTANPKTPDTVLSVEASVYFPSTIPSFDTSSRRVGTMPPFF